VTVDCPFECEYLEEAHAREKKPPLSADDFPNQDIRISDRFLAEREPLLIAMGAITARAALEAPGTNDYDVREALQSLIRTYRTLQSGLYYETKPANPLAAHVVDAVQAGVADFRERVAQQQGMHTIRDPDVLGVLVFLERLELQHNNGRKKGRAFLHFLLQFFPPDSDRQAATEASRIITS
jgi:hypothetical protein